MTNPYAGGWWARGSKNITYQVTLPAGEHQIMLGCTGWWSMGREMDVYYSVNGGTETKLCDFDAVKSSETYAEGTIELTGTDRSADFPGRRRCGRRSDPESAGCTGKHQRIESIL